jgi:two-component system, NarL family, nitrate/nitrite response regulator NarL
MEEMKNVPIRLLIADDDRNIRLLLRRLFEHHAGWEVCDECANGSEALEKALQLAPDIVILDLAMPGMNGLQSAQQILRINPQVPILLLSVQQVSRQLAEAARNIGFRGAVTKGNGREVVQGVETLLRGESFFVLDQTEDVSA